MTTLNKEVRTLLDSIIDGRCTRQEDIDHQFMLLSQHFGTEVVAMQYIKDMKTRTQKEQQLIGARTGGNENE